MLEIGKQSCNYRSVFTPVILILVMISLVLMFIWTFILSFFSIGSHQQLYNEIGLVLWCVWGFTINLTLQITFLYSRLIEIEPQLHLLFLFMWSEVGNMYCLLFLNKEEGDSFYTIGSKNTLVLYNFEKTFLTIANFSFVLLMAGRYAKKYLLVTSQNIQRILVTTSFIVFVSCFFGFFIYASDLVTVLLLFFLPTLFSFMMIFREIRMRTGCYTEQGLRLKCLVWILLVSTILTLPYQMSLIVTFNNEKILKLVIRASLWKCILNPLVILFCHSDLANLLFLFVFGSSFLFDDYDQIPKTEEEIRPREYSPPPIEYSPPPLVTGYGSTHHVTIEPIVEEDENDENSLEDDVVDSDEESYQKIYQDGELKTIY